MILSACALWPCSASMRAFQYFQLSALRSSAGSSAMAASTCSGVPVRRAARARQLSTAEPLTMSVEEGADLRALPASL